MNQRPLSPHLQIYKPQITSVLSIMHRFTGMGLIVGLFLLVFWLACLSSGEGASSWFNGLMTGFIGQVVLFFCLLGFFYHLTNGIRHLAWDAGYGFELETTTRTGYMVVFFSIVLTLLTWIGL